MRGFLTGRFHRPEDLAPDDWRRNHPRFQGENFEKNLALVRALEKMAGVKGVTAAQLALAWVLAQGEHIVPIPGTRTIARLEENVAAASLELSDDELEQLDAVIPPGAVSGARYGEAGMKTIQR